MVSVIIINPTNMIVLLDDIKIINLNKNNIFLYRIHIEIAKAEFEGLVCSLKQLDIAERGALGALYRDELCNEGKIDREEWCSVEVTELTNE